MTHRLAIVLPATCVEFILNGVETHSPYVDYVEEGTYVVSAPDSFMIDDVIYTFVRWQGDIQSSSSEIEIYLNKSMGIYAVYKEEKPPPDEEPPKISSMLMVALLVLGLIVIAWVVTK